MSGRVRGMGTTGVLRRLAVTGFLVLFIHNQITIDAATVAGRKSAPVASPTPPTNKGRKVMVEAFANAGRTPGLEIWRIEVRNAFFSNISIDFFCPEITITQWSFVGGPNFMEAGCIFSKAIKEIYLCFNSLIVQRNGTSVTHF